MFELDPYEYDKRLDDLWWSSIEGDKLLYNADDEEYREWEYKRSKRVKAYDLWNELRGKKSVLQKQV